MTPEQLDEFLEKSEFYNSQKDDIRRSHDKVRTYEEINFWHRLHKVKEKCPELHHYVVRNGIFFPTDLKEKLSTVTEGLWEAVTAVEAGKGANDYKMRQEGWNKIKNDIDPLYNAIEKAIHGRLQAHGRSEQASDGPVDIDASSDG